MVKKIISYLTVLVLIIMVVTSMSLIILSNTILSENFLISMLKEKDYYSKTYNIIIEKFKDNTIQSGLEDDVLEGIITEEQVKSDIDSLIKSLYDGTEISIDTEGVKTRLQENINKVIQENNKKVSKDEQEAIDIYVTTITNIYGDGIVYSQKYVPEVQSAINKIQNMIMKVKNIMYIATALITIILIIINRKESFKYISITAISSGILLVIPKIIESITMQTQNIMLFNQVLSSVVISIIETIMLKFLIFGIVFCIVGFILNIISSIVKSEE